MFRPSNVNGGRLKFPVYSGKAQYISGKATKLLVRNANSVFVKRLTAKEEKRRLQSCCYISKNNKEYIVVTAMEDDKWGSVYDAFDIYEQYLP